jgi:hypothetical protein
LLGLSRFFFSTTTLPQKPYTSPLFGEGIDKPENDGSY